MKKMFNCHESVLVELIHDTAWYRMVKDMNHIRIPGSNPIKLSGHIKDQPDNEWEILDRDGVNIHENEGYVKEALANPDKRLTHPCDVFFDDDPSVPAGVQDKFGTLVLTSASMSPKYLTRQWPKRITAGQNCSWKTILEKFHNEKTPTSNAIVIIDRYLFAYNSETRTDYKNGIRNVFGILNELLPASFSGEFQVLIVFDDTAISRGASIELITKGLQKIKKQLRRDYVPTIELLTVNRDIDIQAFSETHDRKIISNYYMISCDHGFSAVSPTEGHEDDIDYIGESKGVWSQTIRYEGIYAGIDGEVEDLDYSSLPIRTSDYSLSFLRKYLDNLKGGRKGYSYICNGNANVPITDFRNRLITNE